MQAINLHISMVTVYFLCLPNFNVVPGATLTTVNIACVHLVVIGNNYYPLGRYVRVCDFVISGIRLLTLMYGSQWGSLAAARGL